MNPGKFEGDILLYLTYDHNGNLTNDGVFKYVYDINNRLVAVKPGDPNAADFEFIRYAYDGQGRRISKQVKPTMGDFARTEYFCYDGQKLIETQDGSGVTAMQYVYGTQYIDEPLRMDVDVDSDGDCLDSLGFVSLFYHQDANYNVIALTDYSGYPVHRYLYDAYGTPHIFAFSDWVSGLPSSEILIPSVSAVTGTATCNPFLFTGRFYDFETRTYDFRARTQNPELGRFVQRDPMELNLLLNLCEYLESNSINFTDPTGMVKCSSFSTCASADSCSGNVGDPCGPSADGKACWHCREVGRDSTGMAVCCGCVHD